MYIKYTYIVCLKLGSTQKRPVGQRKNLRNHWKTWGIPDVCTKPCGDFGQRWRSLPMASWKITNQWMLLEGKIYGKINSTWSMAAIFDEWMQVAKTQRNCRYSLNILEDVAGKRSSCFIPLESLECKSNGTWIDIIVVIYPASMTSICLVQFM